MRETKSYTIVQNYETEELKTLGFSTEEIKKMKNVSLYDEIISNPKNALLITWNSIKILYESRIYSTLI